MRLVLAAAAAVAIATPAFAQSQYCNNQADGNYESGWVVAIPAGSSDWFNTRYDSTVGTSTNAINVAVADFGASAGYATGGTYNSNLGLDPSGNTPDLSSPVSAASNIGGNAGLPLYTTQVLSTGAAGSISGTVHACVQFPPGDPGLMGVGADTDSTVLGGGECAGSPNPHGNSGFTTNGYSAAAAVFGTGDFGIGPATVPSSFARPHLAWSEIGPNGEASGDYGTLTTRAGDAFGLTFHGRSFGAANDFFLLFISFLGVPLIPVGSPIPSFPNGDGVSTSIRIGSTWPSGAGNLTINFVCAAGAPGVIGSVAISNEVTLCSLPDPTTSFGNKDDGAYESGWVVAIPSGSSDYFSTPWTGTPNSISNEDLAVMDFGSSASSYPRYGQAAANFGLDPAGNTPDLGNVYREAAMTYPALTFVTTSGQFVNRTFAAYTPASGNVLQFIQFPAGDPGLLGVGADSSSSFIDGLAGWSLNGYSTAANLFGGGNWGMRVNP